MDTRAKILIIEGDRDTRTMLELAFAYNDYGYQAFTAANGRSALLQFAIVQPHVVVLDISLPEADGWQTLKRLRDLSTVPIIALAVQDDPEARIASLQFGADYCLTKPLHVGELHARVRALLRRSHRAERAQPAACHT